MSCYQCKCYPGCSMSEWQRNLRVIGACFMGVVAVCRSILRFRMMMLLGCRPQGVKSQSADVSTSRAAARGLSSLPDQLFASLGPSWPVSPVASASFAPRVDLKRSFIRLALFAYSLTWMSSMGWHLVILIAAQHSSRAI